VGRLWLIWLGRSFRDSKIFDFFVGTKRGDRKIFDFSGDTLWGYVCFVNMVIRAFARGIWWLVGVGIIVKWLQVERFNKGIFLVII